MPRLQQCRPLGVILVFDVKKKKKWTDSVTVRASIIGAIALILASLIQGIINKSPNITVIIKIDDKIVESKKIKLSSLLDNEIKSPYKTEPEINKAFSDYCYELLILDNSPSVVGNKKLMENIINRYLSNARRKNCLVGIMLNGESMTQIKSFSINDSIDLLRKFQTLELAEKQTNIVEDINRGLDIIRKTNSANASITVISDFISEHKYNIPKAQINTGNVRINLIDIGKSMDVTKVRENLPFVSDIYLIDE